MSKKIIYTFFISAFMFTLSTSFVLAEYDTSKEEAVPVPTLYDSKTNSDVLETEEIRRENKIRAFKMERVEVKEKIETLREEAKQKMEDLKEKAKEVKDKTKAKIQEERLMGREQAIERFDNAVNRVEDLKYKVLTQVSKMEVKGMIIPNTTKDLSVLAEAKLSDAKIKIAEINTILASSTNTLTKENKAELNRLTQETQTLIREAHVILNDEIMELRKILKEKIQSTNSN